LKTGVDADRAQRHQQPEYRYENETLFPTGAILPVIDSSPAHHAIVLGENHG
jgi:hypothetical protein